MFQIFIASKWRNWDLNSRGLVPDSMLLTTTKSHTNSRVTSSIPLDFPANISYPKTAQLCLFVLGFMRYPIWPCRKSCWDLLQQVSVTWYQTYFDNDGKKDYVPRSACLIYSAFFKTQCNKQVLILSWKASFGKRIFHSELEVMNTSFTSKYQHQSTMSDAFWETIYIEWSFFFQNFMFFHCWESWDP